MFPLAFRPEVNHEETGLVLSYSVDCVIVAQVVLT